MEWRGFNWKKEDLNEMGRFETVRRIESASFFGIRITYHVYVYIYMMLKMRRLFQKMKRI